MKRWLAAGIAILFAGFCATARAQTPPAPAQTDADGFWEMAVPPGDILMTLADANVSPEDALMTLAEADAPQDDILMTLAQAGGPGGGGDMGGGPGPMMGPDGPPPMMMQRFVRFRGGPGMMMGGRGMGGGMMGMMGGGMMLERARQALGLTDEQVTKLHDLGMAVRKDMIRMGADARIAQMDLQDVLRQANPKPEDVKARVAAVNTVRSQMLEKRVNFRLEMKKVFTPEQQEKIKNFMMHRGMGGMGGEGGRGWGGGRGEGGGWRQKPEPKGEPNK